ncbi:MAG: hypothetical protein GWN84_04115 [Gammaproteobacteria bacterium]|nr:hypothetical protein [Gammaproteobacteria bacterium]NIR82185.1 hypothetical protein [Gammaproteobacteria bacterium]NIU02791.1 hypothetical protein [Gammaproteobacteria bacterium]NIX84066.1 hypothetical protein [Gammaproteobacteria bacterium]
MTPRRLIAAIIGLGLSSLSFGAGPQVDQGVVELADEPAVRFRTSGWDHSNTTNPFLLTPDRLTNAMVAVSRLASGQPFLDGGPVIPEALDAKTVRAVLAARLEGKEDLRISTESIGDREIARAAYRDGGRRCVEYAFEMRGYLIHVLLLARPGAYFAAGTVVARKVIETIEPI